MLAIPNMEKPKDCSYCILANKHLNGLCEAKYYCRLEADFEHCPLIEIDDTVWENEKHKLIRMTQAVRFNKAMAERRADCEDETDEEWYDWRDEQEYEDRWERRADE